MIVKDKTVFPPVNIEQQDHQALRVHMQTACKKIAPVWSLENFVAVNPYLGLTNKNFDEVARELSAIGGIQMTLPSSFYLQKIKEGKIGTPDLQEALKSYEGYERVTVESFLEAVDASGDDTADFVPIPTITDVATQVSGEDWNSLMVSRVSSWAASYYDKGQAIWAATDDRADLFKSWKFEAEIDRTPEIAGLKGFRKMVKAMPDDALEAVQLALEILDISEEDQPVYFHRLLLKVGGWSAYAARIDFDNELRGGKDGQLIAFLAVLVCWEAAVLCCRPAAPLNKKWKEARLLFTAPFAESEVLQQNMIFQKAFDLSVQRNIINKFHHVGETGNPASKQVVKAQAVFCIDVRSEIYRRKLERVDEGIETLGFAGFFGVPINYVPLGHDKGDDQCPVLLTPANTVKETIDDENEHKRALEDRMNKGQIDQIWRSFKSGAVSCFSFVSPMGLSYLPKLFTDSFGLTRPVPHPDKIGLKAKHLEHRCVSVEEAGSDSSKTGISLSDRVQIAKNALNAMSLTEGFAEFVCIVGHGSTSVNNPHASGLDCGACAGHSGEANAKVAAAILNDKKVRHLLRNEEIDIPERTIFLACLHDTTTDEITVFDHGVVPQDRQAALSTLKKSFSQASQSARKEKASRMSIFDNIDQEVMTRSKDWSQVRPEWGLAGCSAFVVAPRSRTKSVNLEGKSFLHSYNWKTDRGFRILELIMTAPMVVTNWINLQYYASTVDNKHFGAGNKTLHNVTAGIGVLEGASGDLRVGLPLQSVHDGKNFQHEPARLNVIIEAPMEAINRIIEKHQTVRDLCDNGWIHLLVMNDNGQVSYRYKGNLDWERV